MVFVLNIYFLIIASGRWFADCRKKGWGGMRSVGAVKCLNALKGIKPTETTCFHTLFCTLSIHRRLFYIVANLQQLHKVTMCISWQWIAKNYAWFLKKYVCGRVWMLWKCTAQSSVAKATCQVATRHLGAATESTYVPCPANLFAPATASPPVFVLLSDHFSVTFSWLLFWCLVAFKFVTV